MSPLRKVGAFENLANHALDFRHLKHTAGVDLGSEQAQESNLPDNITTVGEGLDSHVIEIGGTVNGRLGTRLGEVDQSLLVNSLLDHLRHRRKRTSGVGLLLHSQNAKSRIGHREKHLFVTFVTEFVLAISEEDEMVVGQPIEQLTRLGDLAFVHGQLGATEANRNCLHFLAHLTPVVHRPSGVGEHPDDVGLDFSELLWPSLAIDLEGGERTLQGR